MLIQENDEDKDYVNDLIAFKSQNQFCWNLRISDGGNWQSFASLEEKLLVCL